MAEALIRSRTYLASLKCKAAGCQRFERASKPHSHKFPTSPEASTRSQQQATATATAATESLSRSSNSSSNNNNDNSQRIIRQHKPRLFEEDHDIRDLLGSETVRQVLQTIDDCNTGQECAVQNIVTIVTTTTTILPTFEAEASIVQLMDKNRR